MAIHKAVPIPARITGVHAAASTPAIPAPRIRTGASALGVKSGKVVCGIVTPSMGLGGAEQWVCSLLHATDPDRILWHSVVVTGLEPIANNADMVADAEKVCPVRFGVDAVRALSVECDVIIVWGIPYFEEYLATPHCRVITVAHGSGPSTAFCLQGNDFSDGLVAVSNAAILPFLDRSRVVVIPNAADERKLGITIPRDEMRASLGIKPHQKAVCYLGRLSPEKNPVALAEAIALLPRDWVGVAVGDGWAGDTIRAQSKAIAGERVIFAGARADVGNCLNAMDYGILPSIEEGCSIALLEFWMMRVPMIATPVGFMQGRPDLARLIPTRVSGRQLADALLEDERQAAQRKQRVRAAYEFARDELSMAAFGRNWTDYILKIAGTP